MQSLTLRTMLAIAVLAIVNVSPVQAESRAAKGPLKVYVLAGQSNMVGYAKVGTVPSMALDPASKALHDKIVDETGKPRVHKNVSIVYFSGSGGKKGMPHRYSQKQGLLTAGFGSDLGPELAFGITMDESEDDPILIIKTAWGGKSLNHDFRPPSAGPQPFEVSAKDWNVKLAAWRKAGTYDSEMAKLTKQMAEDDSNGWYYREMVKRVKEVLADPAKYSPHYDPKQGYEIAGFVWFQGFNDGIAPYPKANPKDNKSPKDYSEYSRLLSCFIRDVRKEFKTPAMPFVIGVMGVGGKPDKPDTFRDAMAAPAEMPEFKGTVTAVHTAGFWDEELDKVEKYAGLWRRRSNSSYGINEDGTLDASNPAKFGWSIVGTPAPEERQWRFTSFHVDKDKVYTGWLVNGDDAGRAFEEVVPETMKGWYEPDFDDSAWQKGLAPIGKGTWKIGKSRATKKPIFAKNKSTWDDGNVVMMRTSFEVENLDYLSFRLNVLCKESCHVYLNGQKIHSYPWWSGYGYRAKDGCNEAIKKALKKGKNVLAIYANSRHRDKVRYNSESINSVDTFLDGETEQTEALVKKAKDAVFPSKYQEMAKGMSNAAYHYYGSAKIYSLIGEAFAKAMNSMTKAEPKQ